MQIAEAQYHEDYLALAKRLFTERSVDSAYRALKKALVCAPESTAGVSLLGNIRLANGEEMALAAFRRAVLLDGHSDPRAWMNYGNALVAADKHELVDRLVADGAREGGAHVGRVDGSEARHTRRPHERQRRVAMAVQRVAEIAAVLGHR